MGRDYQIEDLHSPVIGLMNTQFAISSARLDARRLAGSPFRESTSIPGETSYENQAVLPRFFWCRGSGRRGIWRKPRLC